MFARLDAVTCVSLAVVLCMREYWTATPAARNGDVAIRCRTAPRRLGVQASRLHREKPAQFGVRSALDLPARVVIEQGLGGERPHSTTMLHGKDEVATAL